MSEITKAAQLQQYPQDSLLQECGEKAGEVRQRRLTPKCSVEFLLTDIRVKAATVASILALLLLLLLCLELSKLCVRRKAASLPSAPLPPTSSSSKRAAPHESLLAAPKDLLHRIHTQHLTTQFSPASFSATSTLTSWPPRSATDEAVLHLSLSSPITQNTLHYILKRFHSIQTLDIDVDAVCSGFQAAPTESIESSPVELSSLVSLTLRNGVRCPPFAWGFTLETPRVSGVFVSAFQLNARNFGALHSTLAALEGSLTKISISRSFICAEEDEEACDINRLKFSNVKQLSVTKRVEDESFLLNSK